MDPSSSPTGFSHLDQTGAARMVDISQKPEVLRIAVAEGMLRCRPETVAALRAHALAKGDVLTVAKIAGIQAAKRTDEIIPLCHSLPLTSVELTFAIEAGSIQIRAEATTHARTGVEMEALTAVSVAALTIYDMCKAIDKEMSIGEIRLIGKHKQPIGQPGTPDN
jgi:cyclic pyranopterin monophosphate synthase